MNPFDHMSPRFAEDNREALDEALYNAVVGIGQPATLAEGVQSGLESIGAGIAWCGFWFGAGVFIGCLAIAGALK